MDNKNRYTGRFDVVANPNNVAGPVAYLELSAPQSELDDNLLGFPTQPNEKSHDAFRLSNRFNPSDEGFRQQLLSDINGITEEDAQLIVRARNALRLYADL